MSYKVGICSCDFHYAVKLMEYINLQTDIPFHMATFSSQQAISDYVKNNTLDFLLLGEEQTLDMDFPHAFVTVNRELAKNVPYIYKYQKVENIIEQIVHLLALECGRQIEDNRVYAVYSPVGRSGKTTLAMGICSYYRNCLYVGMEDYRSLNMENFSEAHREQQELFFYYLLSHNEAIIEVIDKLPFGDTGFRMAGCVSFQDLRQIKKEDFIWFCGLASIKMRFRRMVFDIGTGSLAGFNILACVDRVFVPVVQDDTASEKLSHFRELLTQEGEEALISRITYVEVPVVRYDSEEIKKLIERGGM